MVLNSWFGCISNNPFITHAFYIARDRSYWQRSDTMVARRHLDSFEHLDIPLQWQYAHTSAFIYQDLNSLPTAPVLLSTYWKWKEKQNKPLQRWSLQMQPWCMGLKTQHNPTTPKDARLSLALRAHPRRGQALPPSTLLAMSIKRLSPNKISLPKMNTYTGITIRWGFN